MMSPLVSRMAAFCAVALLAACWSPPKLKLFGYAPLDPPVRNESESREVPVRFFLLESAAAFQAVSNPADVWMDDEIVEIDKKPTKLTGVPKRLEGALLARPSKGTIKVGVATQAEEFLNFDGSSGGFTKAVKYVGIVANFQGKTSPEDWKQLVEVADLYEQMIVAGGDREPGDRRRLRLAPKKLATSSN